MFDMRQLRYYVAVAETLSFTQAAQRLHMSQPPLSQQIRSLEDDLGVRLLDRNKRRVLLTEPGRLFLEEARKILAQAEAARLSVSGAAAGYTGRLRLAYAGSVAFHPALPQALLGLSDAAPGIRVELNEMYSEQQYMALSSRHIDAGFVRAQAKDARLAQETDLRPIDHEPLLLAMPATHPLADRDSLQLAAVAREPFVTQPRALSTTLYDTLVQLAARLGFYPAIRQEVQQVTAMLALVSAGVGLALVPASLRAVQLQGVRMVPLEDEHAYQLLAVATRKEDQSPVLQRFLDILSPVDASFREH